MIKGRIHDIKQKSDKFLNIILDDNDEIIKSIELAFRENNVKKAILISAEGSLKDSRIAITRAGNIRQRIYSESLKIRSVSGEFNRVNDDYLGDIHICVEKDQMHSITGVLLKGYADGEVKITFKIISGIDYGINNDSKDKRKPVTLVKQKVLDEVRRKPKPIIVA